MRCFARTITATDLPRRPGARAIMAQQLFRRNRFFSSRVTVWAVLAWSRVSTGSGSTRRSTRRDRQPQCAGEPRYSDNAAVDFQGCIRVFDVK
jgi:hypothetical protein